MHLSSAIFARVPIRIAHSHNTSDVKRGLILDSLYQRLSRVVINMSANYYFACGLKAGDYLFNSSRKITYLPNSVDVAKIVDLAANNQKYLDKEFTLSKDVLKIVQIGRLEEVKNPFFTIQIARELDRKGVRFMLFYVGQGCLDTKLNTEIKSNGLENSVRLVGLRSDIPELMAGADILLMPSLYEGFPVVLVEAQSAGLKCLVSDGVSQEVDLGVGLVHFASLSSSEVLWMEKLLEVSQVEGLPHYQRENKLRNMGYDIQASVVRLQQAYMEMLVNA